MKLLFKQLYSKCKPIN